MVTIETVRTQKQAKAAENLAWDFVAWLRERYPDLDADIDLYLAEQDFAKKIKDVLGNYGPPKGECLLASLDGDPVGILMLKDLGDGNCELNRMFVRDMARGLGIGRRLVTTMIDTAKERGFRVMNLSAMPRHDEALGLYRSMGFTNDTSVVLDGKTASSVLMSLELTR